MLDGLGNDTDVVDNAGDVVTENVNEGTDTVQSSITYTLGDNLTLENWGAGGSNSLNSFHMNGSWYTTTDAKTWKIA